MQNLLYYLAVILIIGWLIGIFAYNATGLIHILLVVAALVIVVQLIRGRKVV